jgi:hypothetical protein
VAPGKLRGSLIERNTDRVLEVQPTSIHVETAEASPDLVPSRLDSGEIRMTGEIVDSKCYLGGMDPGEGKVHRDGASRCIAGGVPPMFVARDAAGEIRTVLLAGTGREPLGPRLAPFAAVPVEVAGRLFRIGIGART